MGVRRRTLLVAAVAAGLAGCADTDPPPKPSRVQMNRRTPGRELRKSKGFKQQDGVVQNRPDRSVSGASNDAGKIGGTALDVPIEGDRPVKVWDAQVWLGGKVAGENGPGVEFYVVDGENRYRFAATATVIREDGSGVVFIPEGQELKITDALDTTKPFQLTAAFDPTGKQPAFIGLLDADGNPILTKQQVHTDELAKLIIGAVGNEAAAAQWAIPSVASGSADASVLTDLNSADPTVMARAMHEIADAARSIDPIATKPDFATPPPLLHPS